MKKIKIIILIIWMIVIFSLSNQPAEESSNLSNGFINNTIIRIYKITHKEVSKEEKYEIIKKYSYPIRKLAHFTEYFILGIFTFLVFKDYFKFEHLVIFSIIFCFVYACTDEFHQYFVIGRYCSFFDCIIDTLGSFLSILLFYDKKIRKNLQKNEKYV